MTGDRGSMTAGALVGVVGPSGVGKDSVMQALVAARPDLHLVRRVITRPETAGGEVFEGVSEAEFARRRAAGEFALCWPAHGLQYGAPATLRGQLAAGQTCLVNLSRAALAEAERLFDPFLTLHLTAPVAVLAERLAARGREDANAIAARLARADTSLPAGLSRVVEVANDGPLEATVARVLAAFQAERI
ncbi:phosphonate metabolism protein/1,5-bisphosphokinase (PRPP-forming) PhnN [Roseovarius amoyensis]|uniref:phosphonate metabolism protein/1,5-bisphosphokinase (PRPP-forming) PhnN n=1 Tax=Roseovarius amoyensis TaxID=2211448 RepID=UPI001EF8F2EB|nr:phosphonate metabolism protein/1,5-bisphosphokinase (PRPP-forming) PhnN [Roseovarius amoyensis]